MRKEIELGKTIERITIDEAQKIIAQNDDYSTIVSLLLQANGGADVVTGSGIDFTEIWLTEDGSERISMTLGRISYALLTAYGRLF